jgi:leucyl aminopeptidase
MILQKGKKDLLLDDNLVIIAEKESDLSALTIFNDDELSFIKQSIDWKKSVITVNQYKRFVFIVIPKESTDINQIAEDLRRKAEKVNKKVNSEKKSSLSVTSIKDEKSKLIPFIEGLNLSNYQFLKYISSADEKRNSLVTISVISESVSVSDLEELNILSEALTFSKDLVNEPAGSLNSLELTDAIRECSISSGFDFKALQREEIISLEMGGLLAVNKGSLDPPAWILLYS